MRGANVADIAWFTPDGEEMTDEHWQEGFAKSLLLFLNGRAIHNRTRRGAAIVDDSFALLFNAHHEALTFTLPKRECGGRWSVELDTASATAGGPPAAERDATGRSGRAAAAIPERSYRAGAAIEVAGRSLVVLRCVQ